VNSGSNPGQILDAIYQDWISMALARLLRPARGAVWSALATSHSAQVAPAVGAQWRRLSLVRPSAVDPQQEALLDEMCLLVDEADNRVGAATKRHCHQWRHGSSPLHRAFSVFLFDSQDRLLLQQRSDVKITFPGMLTNTCCSHPLDIAGEVEGSEGAIRAARRRLSIELGIRPEQMPESAFQYITRMHYRAPCEGSQWGEHEMDYILILRADVQLAPNANEVSRVLYVTRSELAHLLAEQQRVGVKLTPWFRLITDTWLMRWWQNLDNLKQFEDHQTIHRL